jgi:hypothetical protein
MFEVADYQIASTHIGNCMGTRSKVLITAFRLYGIAIDLDVAPNIAVAHVPPLDLAVGPAKYSSYWLSLYSLLSTRRRFRGPFSILAGAVDAGGCT